MSRESFALFALDGKIAAAVPGFEFAVGVAGRQVFVRFIPSSRHVYGMTSSSLPGSAGIPEFHEVVFEALPTPIFVMDSGLGIIDFNSAAAELAESAVLEVFRPGFGGAVHCVEAEAASCGNAPGCHACVIRNSVREAVDGAQVCRKSARLRLRREGAVVESDHLVTVAPFRDGSETLVLLTLEDMNELAALIARLKPVTRTRFAATVS